MQKTKLMLLAMMPLLMSCAKNGQDDSFCSENSAIYANKDDKITGGTARQIDAYDDYGQKKCGWKPVKSPNLSFFQMFTG